MSKRIFVSHSRADKNLVNTLKKEMEAVSIEPVLYGEQEAEQDKSLSSSQDIYGKIDASEGLIILLGPGVASHAHTQAWIGFEVGASYTLQEKKGADKPLYESHYHQKHSVWLLEDIGQPDDAAIPHVDYAYLFNFKDRNQWSGLKTVAKIIASKLDQSVETFREINELRFNLLSISPFQCPYKGCRSSYELHIYHGKGFGAEPPRGFIAKCSVCRKKVRIFLGHDGAWATEKADYEALLQRIEDLEDIIAMKDALLAPEEEATPWNADKKQRTTFVQDQKP